MEQTVNLQPHQQRVVEEYKELKDKTAKLVAFILDNPIYLSLDKYILIKIIIVFIY